MGGLSSTSMVLGMEGEWRRAGNHPRNVLGERFGCLHMWDKLYIVGGLFDWHIYLD
jgi:hypothetical protein